MADVLEKQRELRLSITIQPDLRIRLEEIAKANNSTIDEIMRDAINLVDVADQQQKKGKYLGFANSEDQLDTKIIGSFSR